MRRNIFLTLNKLDQIWTDLKFIDMNEMHQEVYQENPVLLVLLQ